MLNLNKSETNYFILIIIAVSGIALSILIYIAYMVTAISIDNPSSFTNIFKASKPVTLSLVSAKNEYNIGDTVKVTTVLNMQSRMTSGIDVIFSYDPEFLQLISKEKIPAKSVERVDPKDFLTTENTKFDLFPFMSIDHEKSLIYYAAIVMPPLRNVSDISDVASVYFKALKSGDAKLKFIYKKGETTDSNVAFIGKDILGSVNNLEVIIK